jgi:hypothetical protein
LYFASCSALLFSVYDASNKMDETKKWSYEYKHRFGSRDVDNSKFCKNAIGKYSRARVCLYMYVRTALRLIGIHFSFLATSRTSRFEKCSFPCLVDWCSHPKYHSARCCSPCKQLSVSYCSFHALLMIYRSLQHQQLPSWRGGPTRCHVLFYSNSYRLDKFRALLCPSSGARDYDVVYHIGRFVLGLLYVGGWVQLGWSSVRVAGSSTCLSLQPPAYSKPERNDQCGNQHHSCELLTMGIVGSKHVEPIRSTIK